MKRRALLVAATSLAAGIFFIFGVLVYSGVYGLNVLMRGGGSTWVAVDSNDPRLSRPMQLALQDTDQPAKAGTLTWHVTDRGFEVGELSVMAGENEVDRILLARINPAHFKFVVRTHVAGNRDASDWLERLGAVMVINGSFFSRYGAPDTPIVSSGVISGPSNYNARHGAFVASTSYVGIRDLAQTDWDDAFRNADDGMVSYPLLLGTDRSGRSNGDTRWLANRSFIAQDQDDQIVLGTTAEGFFSLNRLSQFLRDAPLGLKLALNLDGGPVACQAISWKDYRRDFCGAWQTTFDDGQLRLLKPLVENRRLGLPIVLAVLHK